MGWVLTVVVVGAGCAAPDEGATIETVIEERSGGGFPAVRWNHATATLSLMELGDDGYYDVWLVNEDLGNRRPLTSENPALPGKHAGNEDWHPSGRYLAMVVGKAEHDGTSGDAIPGFGGYSDVWLVDRDSTDAWQLTTVDDDYDAGSLFPRFSPDGTKLAWNERTHAPDVLDPMLRAGGWVVKIADFVEEPTPHLDHTRTFVPGDVPAFNEATAWSPDGKKVLLASDYETEEFLESQIYALDVASGDLRRLTDGHDYHEHPDFTPDGEHVVWMTTREATGYFGIVGTDWWVMRADGTNPRRMTYYEEPFHPHSEGAARWPGQVAFAEDGSFFYGGVLTDLISQRGKLVRVSDFGALL
jgi:Tol biopolymer transport system component